MAIQKEIWLNDIVANLFDSNPHLGFAVNADEFVLQGKVVHIPNAGSKPSVKRNRSSLPASVTQRGDADITFALDEFTTDPILIPNADDYELSYDKRASVIGEQSEALSELVGTWMFRYWAPATAENIIRTTGDAVAAHVGTGNRKKLTVADVKRAKLLLDRMGVPADGRVIALDADLYDQFTDELTASQYRDFSQAYDASRGVVGQLFGFTFLAPRTSVLIYTNDATPAPVDPGSTIQDSYNAGGLIWHRNSVIRAMGDHEFFENEKDPTYYGSIYSALVRAGGRIRRNDAKGVIALVQAATT
ncbi:MAG: phage capsid protein [Tenuifilum sp.]|uniref:phage capsid protein n=1 Tax=Tenuifilum sp. TaxID=2760880 RepID=UPI0030B244E9